LKEEKALGTRLCFYYLTQSLASLGTPGEISNTLHARG